MPRSEFLLKRAGVVGKLTQRPSFEISFYYSVESINKICDFQCRSSVVQLKVLMHYLGLVLEDPIVFFDSTNSQYLILHIAYILWILWRKIMSFKDVNDSMYLVCAINSTLLVQTLIKCGNLFGHSIMTLTLVQQIWIHITRSHTKYTSLNDKLSRYDKIVS